jgi:hypothetical protein
MQGLTAELRKSDSARERALSTRVFFDVSAINSPEEAARRGKILREAAAAAPGDRLVQFLWAQASDEESGCDSAHPCHEREMAFARLEPGNSAAWVPVLQKAERDHDTKLRDTALAEITKADHHDALFAESIDAWMTIFERHPMPEQQRRLAERGLVVAGEPPPKPSAHAAEAVLAVAYSVMLPVAPAGVFRFCRTKVGEPGHEAIPESCSHFGHLMAEGPTVLDRGLGLAILRVSDERAYLEGRRQLDWIQSQALPKPYGTGAMYADFDTYVADLRSTGSEIRALELMLQRQGIAPTPPAGWQKPKPQALSPPPAEER